MTDKTLNESIKYTPLIVTKLQRNLALKVSLTEDEFKPYKTASGKDSGNDRSDSEDEYPIEVKADYAKWSINLANSKIKTFQISSY